jgi:hypothetical protein
MIRDSYGDVEKDSCREEFFIGICALADCGADDGEDCGYDEDWTFTVLSTKRTIKRTTFNTLSTV